MRILDKDVYMKHDVFISYSTKNKDAAQAICHVLEQNEIRCWVAPRNIPPGSDYGDVIEDAIKECKSVVVIFSENAASSQYVKSEINLAFEEQKTIIPFRLDETPLKGQNRLILNKTHWIDAYPDYKTKFKDLVAAVALSVGRDVLIESEPISINVWSTIKRKRKYLYVLFFIILITIVILFIYSLIAKHVYTYNSQGLHVKVKGLTESQENAITSILDNMVLVEGGTFIMGNTPEMNDYLTEQDSLSCNAHKVELSNFYISKYEVTQKQWKAFMSIENRCLEENNNGDTAMDMLSWEDAVAFTDTLIRMTGLNFSLPTEAQWEYAARGGNRSHGYIFSGENEDPDRVGWTSTERLDKAEKVGCKRSNELGLYDMTGNVSEWCKDYYAPYVNKKERNPTGPGSGMDRVFRGGDYRMENLFDLKINTRYHSSPFSNRKATGLRLVINLK